MIEHFIRNCLYSAAYSFQMNFFNRNSFRNNLNMINALLSRYAQVTYTKNIKIRETELKDELKKSVESKSEKK